jgi:hypothetical protein
VLVRNWRKLAVSHIKTHQRQILENFKSYLPSLPHAGFVARISGEGAVPANRRIFPNPASLSHRLISPKVNVSPSSVFTSMLTAKIIEPTGPARGPGGRWATVSVPRGQVRVE